MFLAKALLGVIYNPTHPEATKLEKNLNSIPACSPDEKDKRARAFIKASVSALRGSNPEAFKEAVENGTGPFIQLMEAAVMAGCGDKMWIAEQFVPSRRGISRTVEGYYQKAVRKDGQDTTETIIFVSEFPAYFSGLLKAYSEEFEIMPLTNFTHAVTVVAKSGVNVGARVMVQNFCWDCRHLLNSPCGYKDKNRMDWLIARGIAALKQFQDAGNVLPGKSIHGADALENTVENLSESLKHSTATSANLSNSAVVLSHNNASLTDSVQKLATSNQELTKEKDDLKRQNEDLLARLAAAAPPQVPRTAPPQAATPTPKKPPRAKRSAPVPSSATPRSAKKSRRKTTFDVFEDGEDVKVVDHYSIKKWRGKAGTVELSSSTEGKVMVVFPGGSSKLIDYESVESLCH